MRSADAMEAAQAKRDRRNAKRIRDSRASEIGQMMARERLESRAFMVIGDHLYTGLEVLHFELPRPD